MRAGDIAWTRRRQEGFTYVWVMALIAVMGIGLAAVGPAWSDVAKREREQEALRIGRLYAEAIAGYYRASPGSLKTYPPSLDALLIDTRFVGTYRHIRRLYTDPLKPGQPWALVRAPDGGIRGVASTSTEAPLRQAPMDLGITQLPSAEKYSDWQFIPKVD